jgi:hypothetical protein
MEDTLKIDRKDAISILQTLGFKDKAKLPNEKLIIWMDKLGKFTESADVTWAGKTKELVDSIVENKGNIEVIGDESGGKAKKIKTPKTDKPVKKEKTEKAKTEHKTRTTPNYSTVIESGKLKLGQKVYVTYGFRQSDKGKKDFEGILRKDGVEISVKGKTETLSLSTAGQTICRSCGKENPAINGWIFWHIKDGRTLRQVVEGVEPKAPKAEKTEKVDTKAKAKKEIKKD